MFLKDFKSAPRYSQVIFEFLLFHEWQEECDEESLRKSLIAYMQELHDAGKAPTTLRSRYSIAKKFWLHTGRGDLNILTPIIESNLKKWDKDHTIKQAKVFTKAELGKILL
jgi:hypothetical protein